ncbi:hypothetical protein GGR77_001490 [Xanthomonas translucens]
MPSTHAAQLPKLLALPFSPAAVATMDYRHLLDDGKKPLTETALAPLSSSGAARHLLPGGEGVHGYLSQPVIFNDWPGFNA